jgi:hypothetical protein
MSSKHALSLGISLLTLPVMYFVYNSVKAETVPSRQMQFKLYTIILDRGDEDVSRRVEEDSPVFCTQLTATKVKLVVIEFS